MDSSSVDAFSRRKHKLSKRQNSNMGQDLISNLPKHIIGCILSFLPVKEAVRTSILSKRWNNLWTYITKLKFDDMEHYSSNKIRKTRFVDFVDMILPRLLSSANIQSFSLVLSWACDYSYINKWIYVVLTFRIKILCVDLKKEHTIFSNAFFQCKFLEELVLNRCAITFSTFISLSSLTVLKLCSVTITCDSSDASETLALNFPALRKYETCYCIWSGVKIVTLQAPLLEVVSIKYTPRSPESHDVGIEFYAPCLTKFYYCGFISKPDNILLDAHNLAYADIALYNNEKCWQEDGKSWQEVEMFVCKLLSINPKSLTLCVCIRKFVIAGMKNSFADVPPFTMLSHLELSYVGCEFLLGIILKSPCLKTLILQVIYYDGMLLNSATVPHCLLTTLKVVKFEKFLGHDHGLSIAKFIIENGQRGISSVESFGSERLLTDSELVWNKFVPLKINTFAWRLLNNRLPTKSNLIVHGCLYNESAMYTADCGVLEDFNHLFLNCAFFGSIWGDIISWVGVYCDLPNNVISLAHQFCEAHMFRKEIKLCLEAIWLATVWCI